jgi:tRNA(fMet)-specific endonuclease VapC
VSAERPYLLDTNITGFIIRGQSQAARRRFAETLQMAPILISTVTLAEILYGLELRPQATRLRKEVHGFLATVETQSWDSSTAQAYAKLRARLTLAGKTLATADLLIACQAAAAGAILVSHDNAFRHVRPYMSVEDWATDIP